MEIWVTVAPSNSQQFQHLFVQYFHNIYTICAQYMHNICKIYVEVLHNIFIIFVHYLRNICIMYAQYLYNICTIYVLGRLPSQLSMHKFVLVECCRLHFLGDIVLILLTLLHLHLGEVVFIFHQLLSFEQRWSTSW